MLGAVRKTSDTDSSTVRTSSVELGTENEALPIEDELNRIEQAYIDATIQCIDRTHEEYQQSLLSNIRSVNSSTEHVESALKTAENRIEKRPGRPHPTPSSRNF